MPKQHFLTYTEVPNDECITEYLNPEHSFARAPLLCLSAKSAVSGVRSGRAYNKKITSLPRTLYTFNDKISFDAFVVQSEKSGTLCFETNTAMRALKRKKCAIQQHEFVFFKCGLLHQISISFDLTEVAFEGIGIVHACLYKYACIHVLVYVLECMSARKK